MIGNLIGDKSKQWDLVLLQAEFAYNSMLNRSTDKAPFEVVYTKAPNHVLDLLKLSGLGNHLTESLATQISSTLDSVRLKLAIFNVKYKAQVDLHR